jgi:DNA-binding MarR family transcriptional regulator
VYKKEIINELIEIEMRMVEVRDLFSIISERMMEKSVGILRFPVTISQLKAMTALSEDSLISMGELCKMANVKMPSLTEVVDRFETEGILERRRDTGDRRVVKVCFTEKGKKIHRDVLQKRADELTHIFGALNKRERTLLTDSLKNVTDLLSRITKRAT